MHFPDGIKTQDITKPPLSEIHNHLVQFCQSIQGTQMDAKGLMSRLWCAFIRSIHKADQLVHISWISSNQYLLSVCYVPGTILSTCQKWHTELNLEANRRVDCIAFGKSRNDSKDSKILLKTKLHILKYNIHLYSVSEELKLRMTQKVMTVGINRSKMYYQQRTVETWN